MEEQCLRLIFYTTYYKGIRSSQSVAWRHSVKASHVVK